MKKYLELYEDFYQTVKWTEDKCGQLLDDEELRTAIERIATVHYARLSESEIVVFIENYKRGRNEIKQFKAG